MKILKIKIDGYKNINNTIIEFSGFNALVSLNNYGKSNLLEAFDFANDFIKAPNKAKLKFMQMQSCIPINSTTANRNFLFEIEYETKFENIDYIVNYQYSFEWIKKEGKGKRIDNELLKLKKKEKEAKFFTYVNRNLTRINYLSSKTGRCDTEIKIPKNGLIINKLENFDNLFYLSIIKEINNLNFLILSLSNIEKYFEPQSIAIFDETEEVEVEAFEVPSIAKFFYNLKEEEKNKYKLLISSIKDLLPDIEYIKPIELNLRDPLSKKEKLNIPFEIPEKVYDIRVKIKTNNQDTSVNNLSHGSKRIFHILATAITSDFSGIQLLAYEELENSIHPALLQRLLMIIADLTDNLQIMITSHSPYLVRYLDVDDIYLGIPNINGTAFFKKIKKVKQKKLLRYAEDAESNLGDFIFDMLVEGFDDDSFWAEFI